MWPPERAIPGTRLGLASRFENRQKSRQAIVGRQRINASGLRSTATVGNPIAVASNLMDFLHEFGGWRLL